MSTQTRIIVEIKNKIVQKKDQLLQNQNIRQNKLNKSTDGYFKNLTQKHKKENNCWSFVEIHIMYKIINIGYYLKQRIIKLIKSSKKSYQWKQWNQWEQWN